MKRIIVTGASGFVGRHTISPLLERGFEVVAVTGRSRPLAPAPNLHWLACDLCDVSQVRQLFQKWRPTYLLHLAWVTTPGLYWTASANLSWLAASLEMARCFAENGGERLVIAGSSAEYRWDGDLPLDEIHGALNPLSLYGKSKNSLREVVQAWATQERISWAWARIFNVFGPHEDIRRLVPKVIKNLLENQQIPFDNGETLRDFLHVADAGEAFAALVDSPVTGAVNIASGEAVSVRNLVTQIATVLGGRDRILFDRLPQRPDECKQVVASIQRLRYEVGWQAVVTLNKRLEETCRWWQDAHSQDTTVKNPLQ